jgi:HlyD family secretion protein
MELYVIRAPTDGTIVRRYANPGSGASTFSVTAMFQLQPDSLRIVRAEVEERSITLVKAGQKVEIVPESDQAKSYPGAVIRIAAVMGARKLRSDDPSERADERVVEVVVDAEQAPVLVGQRVLVKFLKDGAKPAQAAETTAQR